MASSVAIALYAVVVPHVARVAPASLAGRVVLCLALLAPGSFFMGMPFPLKVRSLEGADGILVPWAWVVNGLASVAGSVLAIGLTMRLGFRGALLIAAALLSRRARGGSDHGDCARRGSAHMKARDYSKPYRVTNGKKFRLDDVDPDETRWVKNEDEAADLLKEGIEVLSNLQEKLYAHDRWALLLVFQAMDAAGKDGTIKHVMSGVNPQGVEVSRSNSHPRRSSITITSGGRTSSFPSEGASASSTARPTRKLSSSASTRRISRPAHSGIVGHAGYLEGALRRHPRLRALCLAQRDRDSQVLPSCVQGRTEEAVSETDREPSKNWKFSMGDVRERAAGTTT